jgi:3-isopropylmalate/(R)-2-methylmalate dehydratase large subunit
MARSKNLKIEVNGELDKHVRAKDVALYIIGKIGTAGGTGYAIEFSGSTIQSLSIEGRMTLCNMAIEAGSRSLALFGFGTLSSMATTISGEVPQVT